MPERLLRKWLQTKMRIKLNKKDKNHNIKSDILIPVLLNYK